MEEVKIVKSELDLDEMEKFYTLQSRSCGPGGINKDMLNLIAEVRRLLAIMNGVSKEYME